MIYKKINKNMDYMEQEKSDIKWKWKGKTDFHNTYSEGWGGKYSSGCLEYLEDK